MNYAEYNSSFLFCVYTRIPKDTILANWTQSSLILSVDVFKKTGSVANSLEPDQTPRSAASDLALNCFRKPSLQNTEYLGEIPVL